MNDRNRHNHRDSQTREKLLAVGGETFARVGFDHATVRDICAAAGANIAAVNYHFGGKEGLYRATFLHFYERAVQAHPPDFGVKSDDPPAELLRAFIRSFFLRIFDRNKPQWMAELMLREMIKPTGVLDELVDRQMVNMRDRLVCIVRAIAGRKLGDHEVFQACTSIVGQIVFHKHCHPIIRRMWPEHSSYSAGDVDALAEHVWKFCLAGVEAMREMSHGRKSSGKSVGNAGKSGAKAPGLNHRRRA
jgi:AcrR family transcriptional regulator